MKSRPLFTIVVVTLMASMLGGLAGCHTHKRLPKKPDTGNVESQTDNGTTTPGSENLSKKRNATTKIKEAHCKTYSANFSCTVDGFNVNGQIRMMSDSIIWVSLTKIIELGRARFTPSAAQGYVKMINKRYDGDYADMASRWGIDIDFATMQALLLGNCPPNMTLEGEPVRSQDTTTLAGTQGARSERQATLKKRNGSNLLDETTITSPTHRGQLSCHYLQRQTIGKESIPCEIRVRLKSRKWSKIVTVKLEKIALNQELNYPFTLPQNYQQIGTK